MEPHLSITKYPAVPVPRSKLLPLCYLFSLSVQDASHQEQPEIRHQTAPGNKVKVQAKLHGAHTLAPAALKLLAHYGFGFGICGLFLELI